MNFQTAAFVNFSGELRQLAQATHDGAHEYLANFSEHPLVKAELNAEQLLAVARMIFEVSQVIDAQQLPDTLGALSDRVNMQTGEYPVKVVLDDKEDLEDDEYPLAEMEEMGRLAELPILLATEAEKVRFLGHPLVRAGIPSNAFRALKYQAPSMRESLKESMEFQDIVSELVKEEPEKFGESTGFGETDEKPSA